MKRILPLLPLLPFLACGCVAFNVGRPQSVKTFEYKAETLSLGEAPRRALSAAPVVRQEPPAVATDAGRVFVGLEGRVLRTDRWSDDEETRRGAVRLRASDDVSPDLLWRWARENVAEIVRDKNVSLVAGRESPAGARFVLLGEALENGVLTVEFEAIQ